MSVADNNETYVLGGSARLVSADRQPCIVCGHPTGDCRGETTENIPLVGAQAFPSLGHEDVHVVEEDVYEERQISPFTKAKVLVAAKGTAMPVSRAKELGLL